MKPRIDVLFNFMNLLAVSRRFRFFWIMREEETMKDGEEKKVRAVGCT